MASTIESRTAERIPVRNRVDVLVRGRVILVATAVNISLGGLLLAAAPSLTAGSVCDVAIHSEGSGGESFLASGRVVRTGDNGTAIQFSRMLGEKTLDAIARPEPVTVAGNLLKAYVSYFKVSQSSIGYECERVFGISRRTFKTITTSTFVASIPAAILPVWALRGFIPDMPNWVKIVMCFVYGGAWLLMLQPIIDLGIIRWVRARAARQA